MQIVQAAFRCSSAKKTFAGLMLRGEADLQEARDLEMALQLMDAVGVADQRSDPLQTNKDRQRAETKS